MGKIFEGYVLISDMDGTLIGSNKKISEENLKAIDEFIDNGGKFSVATGRMVESVREYINELNVNLPTILHNGGKIYDFHNDNIIEEYSIEDHRKDAIKKVREDYPHIGIEIFVDEVVYVYRECEFTKRYDRHDFKVIYDVPNEVWSKDWLKVLLIGEEDQLDKLEEVYSKKYDKGTAFRSGRNYFDVVANGVSKGMALKNLIKDYHIDEDKVVAIGDNMNDIDMLEVAKYGFFIKGGAKRAEERAKLFAPTCDEDAIRYVVDWLKSKLYAVDNK